MGNQQTSRAVVGPALADIVDELEQVHNWLVGRLLPSGRADASSSCWNCGSPLSSALTPCCQARFCSERCVQLAAAVHGEACASKAAAADRSLQAAQAFWSGRATLARELVALWRAGRADEVFEAFSQEPDVAHELLAPMLTVVRLDADQLVYSGGDRAGLLRVVCISDTHSLHGRFGEAFLPPGDVLIHSGDFSNVGRLREIAEFTAWFGSLAQYRHRILIAGNHDLGVHAESYAATSRRFQRSEAPDDPAACRALLTGDDRFVYLEDSEVTVDGLRVYGTPWQPTFCDWAYNLDRGAPIRATVSKIPADVDVLVSHGPPLGYGDLCKSGNRAGCVDLLEHVSNRIRPRVHIFGHIHEAYGVTTNGHTVFVNASTCSYNYRPVQPPVCFDIAVGAK